METSLNNAAVAGSKRRSPKRSTRLTFRVLLSPGVPATSHGPGAPFRSTEEIASMVTISSGVSTVMDANRYPNASGARRPHQPRTDLPAILESVSSAVACRLDPPFLDKRPSNLDPDPTIYHLSKLDRTLSLSGPARTSSGGRQALLLVDASIPDRPLRLRLFLLTAGTCFSVGVSSAA